MNSLPAFGIAMMLLVASLPVGADDGKRLPLKFQLVKEKRDLAVRKIDMAFKVELEKLRAEYTKEGDLDSANYVQSEIERLGGGGGGERVDLSSVTRWLWGERLLTLYPDGTASFHSWKTRAKWEWVEPGKSILLHSPYSDYAITFSSGTNGESVGKKNRDKMALAKIHD